MRIFLLIAIAVISYSLGMLNGPVIISKYAMGSDIRRRGTWNPGYAAFYDLYGFRGFALLVAFDVLKSVIAVLLGGLLLGVDGQVILGRLFAAFCLLLGHVFPVLFMFRGGKGALCAGVMVFFVDWRVALCCLLVFALVIVFTRYASLAYLVGAAASPIFMWIFGFGSVEGVITLLCALVIVSRYAENMVRMIGGTEPQIVTSPRGGAEDFDEEDF